MFYSNSSSQPGETAPQLTPVQSTSLLTCFWRDRELRTESEPLARDTIAASLLDAFMPAAARAEQEASPLLADGQAILAVRTRAIDDWLEAPHPLWQDPSSGRTAGHTAPPRRQIVSLGAGMCTRPYRLGAAALSGAVVFEVDDGSLLGSKRRALAANGHAPFPSSSVVNVPADAADAAAVGEALAAAGLDENLPTAWVAEGLLEYLAPEPCHGALFAMAKERGGAPGSRFIAQVRQLSW